MATYIVGSAAELQSALAKAQGGDQIQLKAGNYGNVSISGKAFASDVTITAQDPNNPPSFNMVALNSVKNLVFDNVKFDFKPDASTLEHTSALRADNSSGISIVNSQFIGGNAVAGIDPSLPAGSQGQSGIKGWPIGRGMTFINSSDITIDNNKVTGFTAGVRFSGVDNIQFNNNEISGFRKVPVGGGEVSNVTMTGNYFHDATPWKLGALGDHGDFVHFWTSTTQTTASSNFVFKGNFFDQGSGTGLMGIYLDDNTNKKGFTNVLIEGNVIHTGNGQALRLEDVVGLTIKSNTIVPTLQNANVVPQIQLADGTKNAVIDGNILSGITGPAYLAAAANNIKMGTNVFVQITDPTAPNYVGNVFVDGFGSNHSMSDFVVIPTSIAKGLGATVTPSGSWGYIADTAGSGLNYDKVTLDASNIFSATGTKVNLAGATVTWDFGDGTKGTGTTITHDYDTFGTMAVKATVKLANGTTLTLNKNLQVQSPVPVSEDFDDKAYAGATTIGSVRLDSDGTGGSALRLTGSKSAIKYANTPELAKNSAFTLSFDFKKDVGTEGSGGRVLYFSGTSVIDIGANNIVLRGQTSAGEKIVLSATNVGINNANWHNVSYEFSQKTGTASLLIDGKVVDTITGLKGAQYVTGAHGLHLGNPYGANFKGLLDNLSFVRDAGSGTAGAAASAVSNTSASTTTTTTTQKMAVVTGDQITIPTTTQTDTSGTTTTTDTTKVVSDILNGTDSGSSSTADADVVAAVKKVTADADSGVTKTVVKTSYWSSMSNDDRSFNKFVGDHLSTIDDHHATAQVA